MARRKLVEAEPQAEIVAATNRVVAEVSVRGATCLRTIDVSATKCLPAMGTGSMSGVMVRLRPVGLCTADDMDFAERAVRAAGALTVTRMPLASTSVDADPVAVEEQPADEEMAVLPMIDALDACLRRQLEREGCSEEECDETYRLAHRMLEQAGG